MDDQLIGRERERALLQAWVTDALAGRGSLVLLAGEAGVGKTTLARRALAGSGLEVLEGFGAQGGAAAFGPIDLQWADDATLELLGALARSVGDQPLLIVGAFRSDELPRGHPIRRLRRELRRAGHLRQVTVEPLGAEATAVLLEQALGAAASLRRAVFDRTDGVPFFVNELASALASSGRLLAGPSGVELVEGAGAGRMAFRHALVRDAFYAEVPWTWRGALHRAVAERLQGGHAAPVVVGEHWALGRRPDQARECLLAAAEAFAAVHAYRDAARASRRALALWPDEGDERARLDVLERLAGLDELAGDLGEAITTWREVADGRRQAGDLPSLAGAHRRPGAAGPLAGGPGQQGAGRHRLHRRRPGGRRRRRAAHLGGPPQVGRKLPGGAEPP